MVAEENEEDPSLKATWSYRKRCRFPAHYDHRASLTCSCEVDLCDRIAWLRDKLCFTRTSWRPRVPLERKLVWWTVPGSSWKCCIGAEPGDGKRHPLGISKDLSLVRPDYETLMPLNRREVRRSLLQSLDCRHSRSGMGRQWWITGRLTFYGDQRHGDEMISTYRPITLFIDIHCLRSGIAQTKFTKDPAPRPCLVRRHSPYFYSRKEERDSRENDKEKRR